MKSVNLIEKAAVKAQESRRGSTSSSLQRLVTDKMRILRPSTSTGILHAKDNTAQDVISKQKLLT